MKTKEKTKGFNKKHLFWIIPITFLIGIFLGSLIASSGVSNLMEDYPIIGCIYHLDISLNPEFNNLPFTAESQQEAIQWRCGKETINMSITDYEDIFVFKE